jgi:hypothetical protein
LAHAVTKHQHERGEDRGQQHEIPVSQRIQGRLGPDLRPHILLAVDKLAHQRGQGALRLRGGDAVSEPRGDGDLARLAGSDERRHLERRVGRERNPHIARILEAAEAIAGDADDRERAAVEIERAPEHFRVAIEEPRPGVMAQHGRGAVVLVGDPEPSTQDDRRPERVEIVGRHEPGDHRPAVRGDEPPVLGDSGAEEIGARRERLIVAPAKARTAARPRAPGDHVKAARIANGERPQPIRVENREGDGEQPEGYRERHDGGGDERGAVAQLAPGVAEILRERIEPDPPARLVEPLLGERDVAERAARSVPRLVRAHPFGDQAIGLEIQVGLHLVREVLVRAPPGKERHQPFSGTGPSTRDIAAARRCQRLDCRASCSRPAFVSV